MTVVSRQPRRWALLLFLLPLAAALCPPLYDRAHPMLAGVPFFVWYQLAVVLASAAVTGIVYRLLRRKRG